MLHLLETGQALYVLTAICLLGIFTRAITKHLYKRLLKESANLSMTKNKSLKELRQRAENTYRMNQGLRDSGAWVEHQLYELKVMGMTLSGWSGLCMQWTWLCLLAGGVGAFLSYWYRLDAYFIVMYGGGAVLMAMLTMLFDNGTGSGWREQLVACLQDYFENVMCPRMARNLPLEGGRAEGMTPERSGLRNVSRLAERAGRGAHGGDGLQEESLDAGAGRAGTLGVRVADQRVAGQRKGAQLAAAGNGAMATDAEAPGSGRTGSGVRAAAGNGIGTTNPSGKKNRRGSRGALSADTMAAADESGQESLRDVDYLKRSLEQIAASRERSRTTEENWLKDLKPEEVELIGDILKQYLA